MNEVLMKGMLKMVKNFVTPEQIKEAAKGLIKSAIDFKNTIPLEPGETFVTGQIYEIDGVVFVAFATFNDENKILRFEYVKSLDEVIDNLIKKL